jgi:hypothetical protein
MIDNGYFADGMGREPGEETVLEPHVEEAILFEEFFIARLGMPPHPVLAIILLKYQIQIQFSKYIWVIMSFGGVPSTEGFAKDMNSTISRGRWLWIGLTYRGNMAALTSMRSMGTSKRSLLWL